MVLKKVIHIILLGFCSVCCSTANKDIDIEYTISPRLHESTPVLQVNFDCTSDDTGLITLGYENNSWGDRDIFNCINSLEVNPKPDSVNFLKDSNQIIIETAPNSSCTIQYEIKQDYKGLPLNEKRYRPIIDSTYFHVLGMRLFMIPEGVFRSDSAQAKIKITYLPSTDKELYHNSFGEQHNQTINTSREELYASFFIGGDFRKYQFTLNNDTVNFLTRGNWKSFSDQDIFDILKRTISSQNTFWKEPRGGNFSVSLVPTSESWYSVGGSGFSNSFVSFVSNNDQVTLNHMRWLYNHELLHKWIGRTILNENEVEQYWFSEGFTDYYAYKLQLRDGYLALEEYINIINREVIKPHYQDPVKNVPNAQLTYEEYWSHYARYQKLPYRRGFLYAFLIDHQIKSASSYSNSLDNLMHELFSMALKEKNFRLNQQVFLDKLSKYLNPTDPEIEFEKYINSGELIDFKNQLPEGISIEYVDSIPVFRIDPTKTKELEMKLKS